ncbi:phage tail protein [Alkalihalobacillus sp. NPDC078783]
MYYFDKSAKPKEIKLRLAKPDREIIDNLYGIDDINLVLNYDDMIHEINFTAYTKAYSFNRNLIDNPLVPKLKEGYSIKCDYDNQILWFIVTSCNATSSMGEESIKVSAFLESYSLTYHKVLNYEKQSVSIQEAANDLLERTGLSVGHITPSLSAKFRQFDITEGTKLEMNQKIDEVFEAKTVYETDKNLVHFYEKDELSINRGLKLSHKNYVESFSKSSNYNELVTRLHVRGTNGLTINRINPTGQSYIDDFSFYLYPFKRDEDGNVITHSEYMSDDLCHALLDYNKLVDDNSNKFKDLLEQRSKQEEVITNEEWELVDKRTELQIAKDLLFTADESGFEDTAPYVTEQTKAEKVVKSQESKLNSERDKLDNINKDIAALNTLLRLENNLTKAQLDFLYKRFFKEETWVDDAYFDDSDLYDEAHKVMSELNKPPVETTMSLANFFMMVSEQHNWDRLRLGEKIVGYHKRLGINDELTASRISLNFKSNSIDVTLSNGKKLVSVEDQLANLFYTVTKAKTELNNRKDNYNQTFQQFRIRNNRISTPVASVTLSSSPLSSKSNDDGTANVTIKWEYPDKYEEDKYNIDGFRVYIYSSDKPTPILLGSNINGEESKPVPREQRNFTFNSLTSNKYYTIGVMAYRTVDSDIKEDGVIKSEIVQPRNTIQAMRLFSTQSNVSEPVEDSHPVPFQPTDKVNFNGSIRHIDFYTSYEPPENPSLDAQWTHPITKKVSKFNGIEWEPMRIEEIEKEGYVFDALDINDKFTQVDELQFDIDDTFFKIDEINRTLIELNSFKGIVDYLVADVGVIQNDLSETKSNVASLNERVSELEKSSITINTKSLQIGDTLQEFTTIPFSSHPIHIAFEKAFNDKPSVNVQLYGSNSLIHIRVNLISEPFEQSYIYTGVTIHCDEGDATDISITAIGKLFIDDQPVIKEIIYDDEDEVIN